MGHLKRITILMFAVLFSAAPLYAQSTVPLSDEQKEMLPDQSEFHIPQGGKAGLSYAPLTEPVFEEVKYLRSDPPRFLQERIERLIQGLYVDVPPEYDHYGYEIRRYMASVAGPKVLGSPTNIKGQIKNIKTTELILKYWREAHSKEIAAIEAEIEKSRAPSSTRSSFKYHRGVAEAFFVEAGSWMRNNRASLEYLLEIGSDAYKFKSPKFTFEEEKQLMRYLSLYKAQQEALKEIQGYTPFRMMVY